ncbi:hypothetical protein [Brevibacterium oceani]|nr:hypothetical protein [Brevibacterium oceani]
MTANGFDYDWDDRMNNGSGGWHISEHEERPVRDADDFLAALHRKLS